MQHKYIHIHTPIHIYTMYINTHLNVYTHVHIHTFKVNNVCCRLLISLPLFFFSSIPLQSQSVVSVSFSHYPFSPLCTLPFFQPPPFSPSLMLKPNTLSRFIYVVHYHPFYRSLVFPPR